MERHFEGKTKDEKEVIAYQSFLDLIDKKAREELLIIDYQISIITSKIEKESNWKRTPNGFKLDTNSREDMYGEKHDSYFLKRTESGYKPQPVNPFKKDKDYILDMEKKFFY